MTEYFDKAKETMPYQERQQYYSDKIKEISRYAYQNSPFIKRHFDLAGICPDEINSIEDLSKIPVIQKESVREAHKLSPPFGDLIAVPLEKLQRIYMSPGPIYDAERVGENRLKESKALFGAGLRPGDRVIVTFSYHLVPAGLLFDTALRRLGATVIPVGVGNTENQVSILRDLKVTGYIGTATFLMNLVNKIEEKGCRFGEEITLKTAILTGEKVPGSLRKIFEEQYGIKTRQVYGTADLGLFGYECSEKSGLHVSEEVYVEIIDPKTHQPVSPGEVGEIVVTYFDETFPMIRYGTGDLASLQVEACFCGRTSVRLGEIVGRVGDSFKVRGMFLHEPQVREVITRVKEVDRGILTVTRENQRDWLTLKVELTSEEIDKNVIIQSLEKNFTEICRLKIDTIECLSKGTIISEKGVLIDNRNWD